jgi:hypothetical protein
VSKGDQYRASDQNKIVDAVNLASNLAVDGMSGYSLAGGEYLFSPSDVWCFAKITARGAGGAYTWKEQYPAPGGGWTDGDRSGSPTSDPASEANAAVATTFPFLAILRFDAGSGTWIFFLDKCS